MWNFIVINESFICENCSKKVEKWNFWEIRNHCPYCLYSKHLDKDFPWDRKSECFWIMKPIWIDYKKNKWFMIKHKCQKCDKEILNKLASDDNIDVYNQLSKKF